jgi:hypothetical protein
MAQLYRVIFDSPKAFKKIQRIKKDLPEHLHLYNSSGGTDSSEAEIATDYPSILNDWLQKNFKCGVSTHLKS